MGQAYRVLWGAVLVAGVALGQPPPAEVSSLHEVQGSITAVDTQAGVLTLEHPAGRVELRVDDSTTLFLPGRTGSLSDLRVGQRVRATFEPQEQGAVAQWLELLEPELP